ncbi:hypothetical protein ZWY2020_059518 [Hordeum vulgare]|nr:hypothetical protein ZWY2020_059518 [Hordeum vulgare]
MSSSSSSMGALAAATAMALSGSLVLFSLRRFAKPSLDDDAHASDDPALRPCLSSPSDKRPRGGKLRRKGEKRVRFAEASSTMRARSRGQVLLHVPAGAGGASRRAGKRDGIGPPDAGEPGGAVPRHAPRPLRAQDRLLLLTDHTPSEPPPATVQN